MTDEDCIGSKFSVKYDTVSDLEKGEVTLLPKPGTVELDDANEQLKDWIVLFSKLYVEGIFQMPTENRLNARFPDMKTVSLEEFLTEAWKGR